MEYCDQSRPLSQVLKKRNPKRPKKPPKPIKITKSENWVVHRETIISSILIVKGILGIGH